LAYSMFGCGALVTLSLLACGCGDSKSDPSGAAGTHSGTSAGQGGGSGSNGASGSNGLAGSGTSGSSGSNSSGAGNSAGADNNGSTCPAAAPCGGDLIGEWTVQQSCLELTSNPLAEACPGATLSLSPLTITGTASFKADNSMTSSGVISFMQFVQLPLSCATEAQCAAVRTSLAAQPTVSDAQCVYTAGTGCKCTVTSTQSRMNSGTYQVQGTSVVLTGADGTSTVDRFCVSGDTLKLYESDANGLTLTLTLTR